ncbi:MAG: LuxR C-terminal-related transcriptional regulator [Spirochaetia bacterium]
MIRAAVLSADDQFHRGLRRDAPDAGVRLELILRSVSQLRGRGGLDVVIVHRPSDDDLESIKEVVGSLPIVVAGPSGLHPDALRAQEGWAVVPDDDSPGVVAAARAAAFGLSVMPADEDDMSLPIGDQVQAGVGSGAIHDLTSREIDVLRLVAAGATNHEVGVQLGISDNTVKYHLGGLYSKLGVARRSEVIFEAIRRGLITI